MLRAAWAGVFLGLVGVSSGGAAESFEQLLEAVGRGQGAVGVDPTADLELARRVSDEAIRHRKQMVLRAVAADPYFSPERENPKYQNAIVGARLLADPGDAVALEYIRRTAGYRAKDDSFSHSSLAGLFGRLGETWDPATVEVVRREVTTWDGFLGGGTENHVAMRRAAGVLFGERFADERFHHGLTGRELADIGKRYMRDYGRAIYAGSMSEYLSPIYLGVNASAWLNVADCARDDEARLMAEAVLDWMLVDLAANSLENVTIPPFQREKGLITGHYERSFAKGLTQWAGWLFFGGGNTPDQVVGFAPGQEPYFPAVLVAGEQAMSAWRPHPVIRNLAAKRLALPYMLLQSRAGWPWIEPPMMNPYGKTRSVSEGKPADPRYQLRSVYVDRHYALGAGYFKEDLDDPLIRTMVPFGATWVGPHENNFLLVTHPYWYAQRPGLDGEKPLGDDDRLGLSPFCRAVHWENAAVLVYDLPARDPFKDMSQRGSSEFLSERGEDVIRSIFVQVPDTTDERIRTDAGFFARAGDVYIALRPLAPGGHWTTSVHPGFVRLALPGAKTGLAIEVGDRREYGSFEQFQSRIAATRLDVSGLESDGEVEYVSSRGHRLRVAQVAGSWLPDASVNGAELDFDRWPTCLSPYVRCRDRVLDVNDGRSGFTIDWRGELPEYRYYDLHDSQRQQTGRRFLRDGRLVAEGTAANSSP